MSSYVNTFSKQLCTNIGEPVSNFIPLSGVFSFLANTVCFTFRRGRTSGLPEARVKNIHELGLNTNSLLYIKMYCELSPMFDARRPKLRRTVYRRVFFLEVITITCCPGPLLQDFVQSWENTRGRTTLIVRLYSSTRVLNVRVGVKPQESALRGSECCDYHRTLQLATFATSITRSLSYLASLSARETRAFCT